MLKFVAAILDGDHIFQKFLKGGISSLDNEEQGKIREFDQTVLTFFLALMLQHYAILGCHLGNHISQNLKGCYSHLIL